MTRNGLFDEQAPPDGGIPPSAVDGSATRGARRRGSWPAVRRSWHAFVREVLRRPLRIGLLVLLGASVSVVVADARGWWIVLGIVLFQLAASGLVALWLDAADEPQDPEPAGPARRGDGRRDAGTPHPRTPGDEPQPDVPGPRVPDPDE